MAGADDGVGLDGNVAAARWDQPGLGPALAPFLPRGLPLPVQQYGRVLYR